MHFFTADDYDGHQNVVRYCNRPFATAEEMDDELVRRHNMVIKKGDTRCPCRGLRVCQSEQGSGVHQEAERPARLHPRKPRQMACQERARDVGRRKVQGHYIVVCHYAMRVWPYSDDNSWQLFGHSHGLLNPIGKQWDIGVDVNDFTPVSYSQLVEIMAERPDNPDLIPTP